MTQSVKTVQDVDWDNEGYIVDPQQWNRDLAVSAAGEAGLEALGEDHWRVIDYLREHFLQNHTLPPKKILCHELELREGCIEQLFGDDMRLVWRIAGLPNPGEEAKSYMSSAQ